tara:strand:+ start:1067 stop:1630 length:564 start_codon:yes stop_codon:yes gene_type:complete
MNDRTKGGALAGFIAVADRIMDGICSLFLFLANASLALMLVGTAATIVLRPLNVSFYWIWPWTMQFFVWMSFFGFYVIYRKNKDIAVDFLVRKYGDGAMTLTRYFVALTTLTVTGLILAETRIILEGQIGDIEGVITPWGTELERYTLSIPLFLSTFLVFVNALLEILKATQGMPEPLPTHLTDPDS